MTSRVLSCSNPCFACTDHPPPPPLLTRSFRSAEFHRLSRGATTEQLRFAALSIGLSTYSSMSSATQLHDQCCEQICKELQEFALFLGKNNSIIIWVKECPEPRRNCVCLTDDGSCSYEKCHEVISDVGVFDLEKKSLKPCGGYDICRTWPPPTRVVPSVN